MKRFACEKLAIAEVSVISKQILVASRPLRKECRGRPICVPFASDIGHLHERICRIFMHASRGGASKPARDAVLDSLPLP
jgi:hypothetical protein